MVKARISILRFNSISMFSEIFALRKMFSLSQFYSTSGLEHLWLRQRRKRHKNSRKPSLDFNLEKKQHKNRPKDQEVSLKWRTATRILTTLHLESRLCFKGVLQANIA